MLLKVSRISMAKSLRHVGIGPLQLLIQVQNTVIHFYILMFTLDRTTGFTWTDPEPHLPAYLSSEAMHDS